MARIAMKDLGPPTYDHHEARRLLAELESALEDEADAASRASSLMQRLDDEGIDYSEIRSRFL